jgi:AraC-like DNA-binding protein
MHSIRRTLFEDALLRIDHLTIRPASAACGAIERQDANVLVLPLSGVFAKHDGPRRHAIATPNHVAFIAAGAPYRLSFPGGIGDTALSLRFSGAALSRLLPAAMKRDGLDSTAFASIVLLPPATMLDRALLCSRVERRACDPLEVEEVGVALLAGALHAARIDPRRGRGASPRSAFRRQTPGLERVKEAIAIHPERKWTLDALARIARVSPYHLAHLFRRNVGAPVYEYVTRSRLNAVLDAVLATDKDLMAIALEAGFASHSHFTARFRALFGMTPTQVRRQAGAGPTARRRAAELRKIVTARPAAAALFIHGVPLNGYHWRHVIGQLQDVRRCIALDLMGLGYIEIGPKHDVSFVAQARMVREFLDALGLDQVDLVTNDSGGAIAQIVAANCPERIRTLTNCDVHDNWPPAAIEPQLAAARAGVLLEGARRCLLRRQVGALAARHYSRRRASGRSGRRSCSFPKTVRNR